jgi:uncharacterized DUF497 family protein
MSQIAQRNARPATELARLLHTQTGAGGLRYAALGQNLQTAEELAVIVDAVPSAIAGALSQKLYVFAPLVLVEGEAGDPEPWIALEFDESSSETAVCHRNVTLAGVEYVFISTALMQDRFALSFELYINLARHFVEAAGVPAGFMDLVWQQATAGVRGETSHDAWEDRARALGYLPTDGTGESHRPAKTRRLRAAASGGDSASIARPIDEQARMHYLHAAFSDAIAIYLLSLTVDFDYTELREREYPLLAPPALAERLRAVAALFPPNAGQEFAIRYRRREE